MKKTTKNTGIKVTTGVKVGGFAPNHARAGLKVKSAIKAGGTFTPNHSRGSLKVRSAIKAGGTFTPNHSTARLTIS